MPTTRNFSASTRSNCDAAPSMSPDASKRRRQHLQVRGRLGRIQTALLLVDSNRPPQAALRFRMISQSVMHRAQIAQPVRRRQDDSRPRPAREWPRSRPATRTASCSSPCCCRSKPRRCSRRADRIGSRRFNFASSAASFLQQPFHFVQMAAIRRDRRQRVQHLYQQLAIIGARRQLQRRADGFLGLRQFVRISTAAKLFSLRLGQFQTQQNSLVRRLLPPLALDDGLRQMQFRALVVRFLEQPLARSRAPRRVAGFPKDRLETEDFQT